jgi:hypothetical protein
MVGWARSVVHRSSAIPGCVQMYTLCRVVRSIAIVASSDMDMSTNSFVLMLWDHVWFEDRWMVTSLCDE